MSMPQLPLPLTLFPWGPCEGIVILYHALFKNLSYYPESEFQMLGDSKKSQQGEKNDSLDEL